MTVRKLFNFWFGKKREGFYLFLAIAMAALYLTGTGFAHYGYPDTARVLQAAAFAGVVLAALLFLIHWNLFASHQFLHLFRDLGHLPKKQIEHVNSFCMTVFLCVSLAVILLLPPMLEPAWQALYRWVLSWYRPDAVDLTPEGMAQGSPPSSFDFSALSSQVSPPPLWAEILGQALEILGTVITVVFLLFVLRAMAFAAWRFVTRPRHFDDDEKIYLKPTLSMPLAGAPGKRQGGIRFRLSYEGRIRSLYRKEILSRHKSRRTSPRNWASPEELEKASGLDSQTLHQMYEKARYGPEPCTRQDWDAARKPEARR